MVVLGFCEAARDPSLLFANSAPKPRQDVWFEGEAVRLVKEAWQSGCKGLAVLLAVAWDSQLSPVDARDLRVGDMRATPSASGLTLRAPRLESPGHAPRSARAPHAFCEVTWRACPPSPWARCESLQPIWGALLGRPPWATTSAPCAQRCSVTTKRRRMADFRRSGATEALAGNVSPEKLSKKMANTLSASNRLHHAYAPVQLASVRDDDARKLGWAKLREQNPTRVSGRRPKSIRRRRRRH